MVRNRMRTLIEAGPFVVVGEAESVAHARLLFHHHAPDAVVLDLQLADGTGYQLLEEIKRSHPACVVMVLTNFAVPAYRERCMALGADHFLEKMTEFDRVLEVLSALRGTGISAEPGSLATAGRHPSLSLQAPMPALTPDAERLLQCVASAIYTCAADGRITFYNVAAAELWGDDPPSDPGQWCGTQRLYEATGEPVPLDQYPARLAIAQAFSGSGNYSAARELIVRRPDGSRRHVLSSARPWPDASGALAGVVGSMVDITELCHADAARLQRELVLQRTLDASRLAVWDLDFDSGRVQLSEGWSEILGQARAPTTTTFGALACLVPTEDRARIDTAMKPAVDGASAHYSVEHRVLTATGNTVWIHCEGKVIERDARGQALRAIGTNRDITSRKNAELAMAERQAKFQVQMELSAERYWEQDEQFRFTSMSRGDADHPGLPSAAHLGKTLWELPNLDLSLADWQRHRDQLLRHEPFHDFEISLPGMSQKLHAISVSGMPLFDAQGHFTGYCGVSRDITRQGLAETSVRSLEAQLRESHKLAAIGTLTSGIAHDVNGFVGAILGHVALARDDIAAGRSALPSLDQIHRIASRARDLAQQVLSFSHCQPQVKLKQPLRPLVEEGVNMLRAMLPGSTTLNVELADVSLQIMADATQLTQVLMNLCINAAHALGGQAGQIEISLSSATLHDALASATGELRADHYARLRVRDNGHGMDAETQTRIFEPFFTTKLLGQGTGLGLAIVRNIVDAHGGAIVIDSSPGAGSTFDIYLPTVEDETGAVPLDLLGESAVHGTHQRVLVVDDNEVVALMTRLLLERAGYRVTCLGAGDKAIEALLEQPDAFDIVVTDVRMSEMSGLDLAHRLAQLRPQLPVVMTTGDVSDELRKQALRVGALAILQKENTAEQLVPLVRRILAAHEKDPSRNRAQALEG